MLDRNSVLTLMEECFWDEIETFTIECVSELGTDELEIILQIIWWIMQAWMKLKN